MSILGDVWRWITGAAKTVKNALTSGRDIANQIKAVADSKLLDVAVSLTPTVVDDKILDYVRTGLAEAIAVLGWADKKISDFESMPDEKAAVLTVLGAKAAKLVAEARSAKLTIQESLVSLPVIYNPDIVK